MTIVEFLTARLDDEATDLAPVNRGDTYYTGDIHHRECESIREFTPFPCECGVPERRLADIAAKRRILRKAATYTPLRDTESPVANAGVVTAGMVFDVVLRELASAYADHPDYRTDWK